MFETIHYLFLLASNLTFHLRQVYSIVRDSFNFTMIHAMLQTSYLRHPFLGPICDELKYDITHIR